MGYYKLCTELCHYGVLGMRWGLRRNSNYSTLSTKRLILKEGSKLNRISTVENEDHKGHAYTSFDDIDINTYNSFGKLFDSMGAKHYNMTYKVKDTIVVPSQKERVDTFLDLIKHNSYKELVQKACKNEFKLMPMRVYKTRFNIAANGDPNDKKNRVKLSKAYDNFSFILCAHPEVRDIYFNALQKQGFTAVIDDADGGTISKNPIIVFDRQKSLNKPTVRSFTSSSDGVINLSKLYDPTKHGFGY